MAVELRWFPLITLFVLASWSGAGFATDKNTASEASTRAIMDSLIGSLSEVLPLSFDMKEFTAAKNKTAILKSLRQLKDNAKVLELHGKSKDKSFGYVATALQSDVNNVYRWFDRGYYDEAKFTLQNLTENCIACHSSLPETAKFPKPEVFLTKINLPSLQPLDKAHYLTMIRQFDEALAAYENMFRDPDIQASNLIALGAFTRYLKIAIHVKSDFKRPQAMLTEISKRPKNPVHVQQLILKWNQQLSHYEKTQPLANATLKNARKILHAGRQEMEFPRDRDGLIHYVTANALLNRFIAGHNQTSNDVAEAYYLLGTTEALLSHSFWISKQDFYLETAIRMAPGAAFAPKAYALLEENLISGYTGSGGTNMPDDVSELLGELKALVANAKKEAS